MIAFKINLPCAPVPYQNNVKHGRFGSYKTPALKEFQLLVGYVAKRQCNEVFLADYENHFQVDLHFTFKHKKHGDLDNLAKSIMDALEGVLFNNDKFCNKLTLSYGYGGDWTIDVKIKH